MLAICYNFCEYFYYTSLRMPFTCSLGVRVYTMWIPNEIFTRVLNVPAQNEHFISKSDTIVVESYIIGPIIFCTSAF